jgi:alkanesulfonate monooxygenase SsuD/methylene tetrahydromethanopterin reductase-like flavin-dependent oxidoreductase (luciferase family)
VRFGLQLAPVEGLSLEESCRFAAECARLSSRYPFDMIVAPQHYHAFPATYPHAMTLLACLAGETGATLATGVLALPLLPAVDVAESAYTLFALSGGRFVLGLGLGYRRAEYESFDVSYASRAAIFEEKLRLIYDTWSQHETRDATRPLGSAGPVRPQVWIGASATRGIRRAAAMADGWLVPPLMPPRQLARELAAYRQASADARRLPARRLPIRRDVLLCGPRAADRRVARQRASRRVMTYASWGLFGSGPERAVPPGGPARDESAEIVGTVDECRMQLSELQRAVGQPVVVIVRVAWPGMSRPEVLDQIRLVGEELIPAMSEEHKRER